ncbi:hypothetical protein TNCV_3058131 [Trichonephila clavipes]|nr:hypothetical protein TNCV_3058131 [Trichonephila clavipes]
MIPLLNSKENEALKRILAAVLEKAEHTIKTVEQGMELRYAQMYMDRVGNGLFICDEAHFWLNGYVNKQNCRIWSEANPQVYVETPLHPEKLTVWCTLWAGGILLQKR